MSSQPEQFDQLLQFFKVLANESRLKILGLLAIQAHNVGEIAEHLEIKEPTVSHHLAAMKKLGLVASEVQGNVRLYSLNMEMLEQMSKNIFSSGQLASLAPKDPQQKVLEAFVVDNRLRDIPLKRSKRRIILEWLVQKLERDRTYYELELNQLLKAYHPDVASLRRYMVEERLLARNKENDYWRIDTLEAATQKR